MLPMPAYRISPRAVSICATATAAPRVLRNAPCTSCINSAGTAHRGSPRKAPTAASAQSAAAGPCPRPSDHQDAAVAVRLLHGKTVPAHRLAALRHADTADLERARRQPDVAPCFLHSRQQRRALARRGVDVAFRGEPLDGAEPRARSFPPSSSRPESSAPRRAMPGPLIERQHFDPGRCPGPSGFNRISPPPPCFQRLLAHSVTTSASRPAVVSSRPSAAASAAARRRASPAWSARIHPDRDASVDSRGRTSRRHSLPSRHCHPRALPRRRTEFRTRSTAVSRRRARGPARRRS